MNPMTKVKAVNSPSPVMAAPPGGASILQTACRRAGARLADLARAAREREARYRAELQLARMGDHLLRDVGLTRDDVRSGCVRGQR